MVRPAQPRVGARSKDAAKGRDPGEALPHFRAGAGEPELPRGELGIRVTTTGVEGSTPETARFRVDGVFRVPRALVGPAVVGPETALRRIVIAMTCASSHDVQARHAFRDELVFADDVRAAGEAIEGSFHLDLLRTLDFVAAFDTYYLSASLGTYLSDVVPIEAHLPWLAPALDAGAGAVVEEAAPDDDDGADEEPAGPADNSWEVDDPF